MAEALEKVAMGFVIGFVLAMAVVTFCMRNTKPCNCDGCEFCPACPGAEK